MKKNSANNVADWFLLRVNTEAGDTISPLKLQKLIYYAQAWHLAVFGQSLFEEEIEAWMHGPVVPSVYSRFQVICKDCTIDIDKINLKEAKFDQETEQLLFEVQSIYGEHTAGYLETLTHSEQPWIEARKGLPAYAKSNSIITKKSMLNFYKKLNGQQTSQ